MKTCKYGPDNSRIKKNHVLIRLIYLIFLASFFLMLLTDNANAALYEGLVVYMHFDNNGTDEANNTNIRDFSPDINTNDTEENDAIKGGGSAQFNSTHKILGNGSYSFAEATSDYMTIQDNTSLFLNNSLTICVWVFPTILADDSAVVMKSNNDNGEYGFLFHSTPQIAFHTDSIVAGYFNPTFVINNWYLICTLYNGSGATNNDKVDVYLNNTNMSLTQDVAVPSTIVNTANNITLGYHFNLAGRFFTGNIDELAIWNRTLLPSELSDYWNNGTGAYISSPVVADTTAPTFSVNKTNNTAPKINENVNFSIDLADGINLSRWIFSYDNGTGTFTNDSAVTISGTNASANRTRSIDRANGVIIQWRWFANDSSSNWNASPIEQFTVANTVPTILAQNSFTNTSANHSFIVTANATEVDGGGSIIQTSISTTAGTCQLHSNSTIGTSFGVRYNCSGAALAATTIRIGFKDNASTPGEVNTTASNNTYPNQAPTILTQNTFTNASANHSFDVTANATDTDGTLDFLATSISTTAGACQIKSNSSGGNNMGVTYNCSGTALTATTIRIGFKDTSSSEVNTTASSNSYPDQAPTAPTVTDITPATSYANDTLTSGAASSTDADGDTIYYYMKWNTSNGITLRDFTNASGFDSFNCATSLSCNKSITVTAFARAVTLINGTVNSTEANKSKAISNFQPNITLSTPTHEENTNKNGSVGNKINFTFYPYDTDIGKGDTVSCSIFYNRSGLTPNSILSSNTSVTNANITGLNASNLTSGLTDGKYSWLIQCNDGTFTTNSTTRNLTIDADTPDLTWTYPSLTNSTLLNSTTLNLKIQCADTNIERVNMTLAHKGNGTIIKSNLTTNISGTPFSQNDSISLAGQSNGNYTVEMSCADDVSGSPTIEGKLSKTEEVTDKTLASEDTLNFKDGQQTLNMVASIEDSAKAKQVKPADLSITSSFVNGGTKIKFGYSFTCPKDGCAMVIDIYSNDTILDRSSTSGRKGHLKWGSYFTDFNDVPSNMTVQVTKNNNTYFQIRISGTTPWQKDKFITIDPVTGGLNTQTETATFTLDTTAPTFDNNATNKTNPRINEHVNISINITDVVALSHWIFSWDNGTGTFVNDSAVAILTGTEVNVNRTRTIDRNASTVIQWRWFANDSANNWGASTIEQLTVQDTATNFTNNITNNTAPKVTENVNFSINILDADGLSHWIFSYDNGTGTFVNDSAVAILGVNVANASVNRTRSIDRVNTIIIQWRWFANSSKGVMNQSTIEQFTVANTVPTILAQNSFTNTSANHSFIVTANATEADGGGSIIQTSISTTAGTCQLHSNSTIGTSFGVRYNCSGTALASTTIRIGFKDNASTAGEVNTTASNNTFPNVAPVTPNILSPGNNSNQSSTPVNLQYNTTDIDLDAITYFVFINGTKNGSTTGNWSFNATDSTYTWYVIAGDTFTNSSNSTINQFILDSTGPTVNITSPLNSSTHAVDTINFTYNITDVHEIKNCTLYIEQSTGFLQRRADTSIEKNQNNSWIFSGLENGPHYWMVQCYDSSFNNSKNSSIFNFTVSLASGQSAAGGGGAGSDGSGPNLLQQILDREAREITESELLMHIQASLLEKLLPNFKKDEIDGICGISEDPIFIGKSDCSFSLRDFSKQQIFRYSWFSRYLVVAIISVGVLPGLFARKIT